MDGTPQKSLGPYRLDAVLGRGGMGEVFRAWDQRLERWVALKHLLNGGDVAARTRFRREAKAAAKLGHPAIVQIFDIFEEDDGDWIVMELIDGPSLAELRGDGPLDVGLAIDYGRQVASGLAAAHAAGIVHRDLKTENVMVLTSGTADPSQIKIVDFGLAKLQGSPAFPQEDPDAVHRDEPALSIPGRIKGTPRAMSPEQARGLEVDARSDLFSLGVLLYELSTARSPFWARTMTATLFRVCSHQPPAACQLNPRVPRALSELISQLLEKDPEHRPQAAHGVVEALSRIAGESPLYRVSALEMPGEAADDQHFPIGVVVKTLLISDLVDSTKLMRELGDHEAAALFQRHDRLARDLLAERGGREIDKTEGFLFLFTRPWDAISYALAYHEGLRGLSESSARPLVARVGIHVGTVILQHNSAEDVRRGAKPIEVEGLAKPMTARLMSLAQEGQTLLTRSAFDVARRGETDASAGSLRWLDHGRYRFKGVDEEVEVFEVGVPGVEPLEAPEGSEKVWRVEAEQGAAPPAPAAETRPVFLRRWPPPELPGQPYPVLLAYSHPALLAGREREIAEVRRRLRVPVPVLGLSAPSGTGKSSLLQGGLVPLLREEGKPVALVRHPQEAGIARSLLGDFLAWQDPVCDDETLPADFASDDDWRRFRERLLEVERLAGEAPILILDQFENVLRPEAGAARQVLGVLLAASAQRRPGIDEPPCRWLLAYRQEFHGQLTTWLRDVLSDARAAEDPVAALDALPYDLAQPDRFHSMTMPPLASLVSEDALSEATEVFRAAIEKPLALTAPDGTPRYPWRFAAGHAERLARSFAEARLADPDAPLTPELQVVLAHLLARARGDTASEETEGSASVEVVVGDDPASLIDEALEDHLRRALTAAFPSVLDGGARTGRSRALLALRELATAAGRRQEGIPVEDLARAIGSEGEEILEKLATPLTRLVVLWRRPDGFRYVLSHDRLAEAVIRLVEEEGRQGKLLVDAELLALRRLVVLKSALHGARAEQATRLSRRHYRHVAANSEALLWDEERRAWWTACQERRRRDWRRRAALGAAAVIFLALVASGAWRWAQSFREHRALLDQISGGEPEVAFQTLVQLSEVDPPEDLLARLRQRDVAMDVLELGLRGSSGENAAILRAVELVLPWVEETPDDPVLTANLAWALDVGPGRDPRLAGRARALRDQVLEPLRRLRPPPAAPQGRIDAERGAADWVEVPAGSFRMPTGYEEEQDPPRHEVTVPAFRMLTHEVTNAEYRRLVPGHQGGDDLPALVNWYEAYAYAAWRGGRLPTEAEWEYAARANCPYAYCTAEGLETTADQVAWSLLNAVDPKTGGVTPQPVMRLLPNPWGLHDMIGNLWEWTADWFHRYTDDPHRDFWGRAEPGEGRRNLRGGCFLDDATSVRLARTTMISPGQQRWGFRVVLLGDPY